MKSNGRKILKVIRFIFLLPVFWVIFIIVENSFHTSLNDSDLIFNRPAVPIESNAYWILAKATNELYWPNNLDRKLTDLADNTNWNDSLATDVLKINQVCLNLFDEAMQQPLLLVPEPKAFDEDCYYSGWKTVSFIKSIQINSLHRAGKNALAFDGAFEIVKFGQRVENSGGPILSYLVGSSIKSVGFRRIQEMTADTTLDETNLTQYILELTDLGPNKEGLTNSVKVEYTVDQKLIDDFAKGKIPGTTNSESAQVMKSLGMKLLFNPQKTKAEFAQTDRFLFDNFSKAFAKIVWSDTLDMETNPSIFNAFVSGNAIGELFLNMLVPMSEGLAARKSRENISVTATQILLALKVYKMQHGKLPESLSDLVPQFFPQVPLDDFNGKPFGYLPDKKIIYSVGPCLKDLEGKERKRESGDYNLPFKIRF